MHLASRVMGAVACLSIAVLPACRFHSGENMLFDGAYPVAYIKRSIDQVPERGTNIAEYSAGADLFIRDLSDSSSPEINITGELTRGFGDVRDPTASFDGSRLAFSLRCSSRSAPSCRGEQSWNIWEYEVASGNLRRVIADRDLAREGDDISPVYLPDGQIAFSSNRQAGFKSSPGYDVIDPVSGLKVVNLHVMPADGSRVTQVTYSQSVDLDASIMADGSLLFSRLENNEAGGEVGIYRIFPDGSGLRQVAGPRRGNLAYWRARELESGEVIATVSPLSGTWDAGALHYVSSGVHRSATLQTIPVGDVVSEVGRFGSAFPVIDGGQDMLVTYSRFKRKEGNLTDPTPPAKAAEEPPQFGLYLLSADNRALRPLLLPNDRTSIYQPVALNPRARPPVVQQGPRVSPGLFKNGELMGVIDVLSVYDTDDSQIMGNLALTDAERINAFIPQMSPRSGADPRQTVADIRLLKDPAYRTAVQRAARFVRVVESLPLPEGINQDLIGETDMPPVRLLGYAPVEPDGSVRLKVPANTPLAITVLDQKGRAFAPHLGWFNLVPNELIQCNGCHEPNNVPPINAAPIAGFHPNTSLRNTFGQLVTDPFTGQPAVAQSGETMAQTRTRADVTAYELKPDIEFVDVWTADGVISQVDGNPRVRDSSFSIRQGQLTTPEPVDGWVNYAEHVQPIWDKACTSCHNSNTATNAGLDLRSRPGGVFSRAMSYNELMRGEPYFNAEGFPEFDELNGRRQLRYKPAYVVPGKARASYLVEKIFDEELFATRALPANQTLHANRLSPAEKKLVVEWIDMGAAYWNQVLDSNGNVRPIPVGLDKDVFTGTVWKMLDDRCSECHRPYGHRGAVNESFVASAFVLPGQSADPAEVLFDMDFRMTANMVTDTQSPANSLLLRAPSSTPAHFNSASGSYILPAGGADYTAIFNWIQNAATVP